MRPGRGHFSLRCTTSGLDELSRGGGAATDGARPRSPDADGVIATSTGGGSGAGTGGSGAGTGGGTVSAGGSAATVTPSSGGGGVGAIADAGTDTMTDGSPDAEVMDASADAGDSAIPAADGTATGVLGRPCSPNGAYACAGHAQRQHRQVLRRQHRRADGWHWGRHSWNEQRGPAPRRLSGRTGGQLLHAGRRWRRGDPDLGGGNSDRQRCGESQRRRGSHPCGANNEGGGTGGGSGGAILLEGKSVVTTGATLQVNGGNGGGDGSNVHCADGTPGSTIASLAGADGKDCVGGSPGGGGGYGRMRTVTH
jgi:hypothetical protein